ncbi:hypothetical protein C2845_PM13G03250 [Panicum miliaceum]|uniref:Uncharacterized protein n=1 Tax=Panicum miliaceum TaxID=4540 RepID=A0A3L6RJK8_PANMI|nr:hypothetical protein C2845_PM13G03250 [Panicum miliaceum]
MEPICLPKQQIPCWMAFPHLQFVGSRIVQKVMMSCYICLADVKLTDTKTVAEAPARLKKEQSSSYITDDTNHERLVKVPHVTYMEDLQAPRNLPYAPLCIKVFNELNKGISHSRRHNLTHENLLGQLPLQTVDELMDHWTDIQELLHHFWSSYPITNAVLCNKRAARSGAAWVGGGAGVESGEGGEIIMGRRERLLEVERLKGAMTQIYKKLQDMKASAPPEIRHDMSRLVKPMTQVLTVPCLFQLASIQKSLLSARSITMSP